MEIIVVVFKWAIPGLFFIYFWSFSNKHGYNFLQQINVKNVHPVYGAGIQTHNLHIASLIPLTLDQGSRPPAETVFLFIFILFKHKFYRKKL